MTKDQLKAMNARCEAATGGPWIIGVRLDSAGWPLFSIRDLESIGEKEYDANALFIQNARQDLPDCIAEIGRLTPMETALRDLYNDCRNEPCDAQRGAVMDQARKILETE